MTAAAQTLRLRHPAQRQAADPEASAWVTANAGTGKTDVLTDRVTRLLLAGTRPGAILCLTFTKAAAAVMAKRLIDRLGKWTMLDDAALAAEVGDLLGREGGADELTRARQLFARMLDAPGGLRLQTVHAFCESVLKRFPLEAGVPPYFSVAEDAAAELEEQAREKLFSDGRKRPLLKAALDFAASQAADDDFRVILKEIIGQRRKIEALFQAHGGRKYVVAATRVALDLGAGDTRDKTIAEFLAAVPAADLRRAVAALALGSKTDRERAGKINAWLNAADRAGRRSRPPHNDWRAERAGRIETDWLPIFLTEGRRRDSLCTKAIAAADPGVAATLLREQERVVALKDRLDAHHIARATEAMLTLAEAFLDHYAAEKKRRALLDYDDLILYTRDLLRRPAAAAWVLYKLDGGIDHILVDEAQDTAPDQWAVIEALADEYFAGAGAREGPRTVFAVGDEKQSIFSFQGADVRRFAATRKRFAERAQAAGAKWAAPALEVSFRSVPAVLAFVDAVFAPDPVRIGVASSPIRHLVHRQKQPGLVEIWPPVIAGDSADAEPWDAAANYAGRQSPPEILATRIAETIGGWLASGETLAATGKPIRPGDVMILVQSRNAFFEAMVRALKVAGVPVAGADRLQLAEHIAVMDLVALGRFVLLPADELNLATVLKGPLFDFDDDDLFELCWQRTERLWPTLLNRSRERERWTKAAGELHRLLERADFVPPYEFFAEILGAWRGRERIVARLGPEAIDPLDEFLALCLAFEREHSPSLEAFLHWLARGGKEIKRDLEQDRDEVRVLTVHGAKGLESKVVFLPDTCTAPSSKKSPKLLWQADTAADQGGVLFWPTRLVRETAAVRDARAAEKSAHTEEHRRLLYVAATRAEDRLYVCGWHRKAPQAESWYAHMQAALAQHADAKPIALPWGEAGLRLADPVKTPPATEEQRPSTMPPAKLPPWAVSPPAAEPVPAKPLTPSRPSMAEPPGDPLGTDQGRAFRRGRLIHRLLEILAPIGTDQRTKAAASYLASPMHGLTVAAQKKLAREVLKILAKPEFASVFGANSLAEVPIAGRVGAAAVAGQIDRMVVGDDEVLIVDFKSGRQPPKRPEQTSPAYIRQLALYRAVMRDVFPTKTVRCALLWTDKPSLMEIPDTVLAKAEM